jgi:hypothetical protein
MKRFLVRLASFLVFPTLILILIFLVLNQVIKQGDYFRLNPSVKNVIIGHSMPQLALNDSLISNTRNMSKDGGSYFYIYYRIKKTLESNPQIKNVFIDVSNNIFYKKYNENIYRTQSLTWRFSNVAMFVSLKDATYLLVNNFTGFLKGFKNTITQNIKFLKKERPKNFIEWSGWGEYYFADQVFDFDKYHRDFIPDPIYMDSEISDYSIWLLKRTIKVCDQNGVNVILIRTPINSNSEMLKNEKQYLNTIKSVFGKYKFLDFKDFYLEENEYRDISHLNYKGARKFSKFFNEQIRNIEFIDFAENQSY